MAWAPEEGDMTGPELAAWLWWRWSRAIRDAKHIHAIGLRLLFSDRIMIDDTVAFYRSCTSGSHPARRHGNRTRLIL